MTRIQCGLTALNLFVEPLEHFLALPHVFASPDRRIYYASAIQEFFLRYEAKVGQAPVDGAGFSVFIVSVFELRPSANAGTVAKAIIRAARTSKRFIPSLRYIPYIYGTRR